MDGNEICASCFIQTFVIVDYRDKIAEKKNKLLIINEPAMSK